MTRILTDNALVDRLKSAAGWRTPDPMRPMSRSATVSDLFPWRVGGGWNTRFDLMNMPSLVSPHCAAPDRVTLIAFDAGGAEARRFEQTLEPFETARLEFTRGFPDLEGHGAFACFHDSAALDTLPESRSWLAERGYVAYRREQDPLWAYVHGNAHALAAAPADRHPVSVATQTSRLHRYRPQAPFDDCDSFAVIFVNPLPRAAELEVRALDGERGVVETRRAELPPRGTEIFAFDNVGRRIAMIENQSPRTAWRPIIFKYYESHFDVFHA